MKQLILIFTTPVIVYSVNAQYTTNNIPGDYYLQGVRETGSGFQLKDDSTFQFFYSYGALDRFGKGNWKMGNDSTIILNSRQKPPVDFKLAESKNADNKFITIQIKDNNAYLLNHVLCMISKNPEDEPVMTGKDGIAKFPAANVDSIYLVFEFCPERYSAFAINKDHNYYTFSFEPWIAEVFFSDFILHYHDNMLTGKHPLLDDKTYRYVKE